MEESRIPSREKDREEGEEMNSRANTHPPRRLIPKRASFLTAVLLSCPYALAAAAVPIVDAPDYPGPAWSPRDGLGNLDNMEQFLSDKLP
jgi:hypothetical protein